MDENGMVEWWQTAQKLAASWAPSMRHKCSVKIDADELCDVLVDLWLEKRGQGPEFDQQNRGMLYNYALKTLGHSRDAVTYAGSASDMCPAGRGDDAAIDEDRLVFLSSSDDEDADDDLDPAERIEAAEMREALGGRLEELAAIRDTWLSGALAEVFEITRRSGQTFAGEIRREKMLPAIMDAARERGMTSQQVKVLAAEIAVERRRSIDRINTAGGEATYSESEIEAFEQMMGIGGSTTTAKPAKTRSRPAKSRRTLRTLAPAMPMVPQPQQQPIQMELV